jgi:hypothetical protein
VFRSEGSDLTASRLVAASPAPCRLVVRPRAPVGSAVAKYLLLIGDREALGWVLSEQRMAFPDFNRLDRWAQASGVRSSLRRSDIRASKWCVVLSSKPIECTRSIHGSAASTIRVKLRLMARLGTRSRSAASAHQR